MSRSISAALVLASLLVQGHAQQPSPFATRVVSFDTHGNAGGGIFAPANMLGAPQGGGLAQGSLHVHSLGIGGEAVLGFDVTIEGGPGSDLLVGESAFSAGGFDVFAEAVYVEVSTDGVHFARFPSRYAGPAFPAGSLGVRPHGSFAGLAGQSPVFAGSVATPNADPLDVVEAGGDAFDLADLLGDPLVQQALVDLHAIHFVRLVDVRSGIDTDSSGVPILDAESGSADIDAVTALHFTGELDPHAPLCDVRVRGDGTFDVELADPDGLADLDWGRLRLGLFGRPIDPGVILGACTITALGPDHVVFTWPYPLPGDLRFGLAVSIADRAGHRSGDARTR